MAQAEATVLHAEASAQMISGTRWSISSSPAMLLDFDVYRSIVETAIATEDREASLLVGYRKVAAHGAIAAEGQQFEGQRQQVPDLGACSYGKRELDCGTMSLSEIERWATQEPLLPPRPTLTACPDTTWMLYSVPGTSSSYFAGPPKLVKEVMETPGCEALVAGRHHRFDTRADTMNARG